MNAANAPDVFEALTLVAICLNLFARKLLTDLGTLQWQEINPDIFGSMFQAIAHNERRSELGQHYTSVPNILKTIEPLFLDELRKEFDRAANSIPKLRRLLDRISKIKILEIKTSRMIKAA